MDRAIIVFLKNPVQGVVKTRLASSIGSADALKIYELLLEHTRMEVSQVAASRYLFYADKVGFGDSWPSREYSKRIQRGNDLGTRMKNAFEDVFAEGAKEVIILGSDCPEITCDYINTAFTVLENPRTEIVFGPATDGGYVLCGLKQPAPEIFLDMQWSHSRVLHDSIIKAGAKKVELMPPLRDVDTLQDLELFPELLGKIR